MVIVRRSIGFLRFGLVGAVAVWHAAVASQAYAEAAGKITLPPGFKAELVYEVPAETEGSWVANTPDDKGRLIASDQLREFDNGGAVRGCRAAREAPERYARVLA